MKLFLTNCAGLTSNVKSLKHELLASGAEIFALQKTHFSKKGTFKFNDFQIFESIRKNKKKGGTMIVVNKALNSVLIEEYSEIFQLLVVEFHVGKNIRVISGCGPQETCKETERMPFFLALEAEISKAEMDNKSVIIVMDANSKLCHHW